MALGPIAVFSAFLALSQAAPPSSERVPPTNAYCFGCHGNRARMERLTIDETRVEALLISPEHYLSSNHRNRDCVECHPFEWPYFPHTQGNGTHDASCPDCHRHDERFERFGFEFIEEELSRSVHKRRLGDKFTCYSCHDPHRFDIPEPERELSLTVRHANQLCRGCHLAAFRFSALTDREPIEIGRSHAWLPNLELHWQHVRCLECHTPHQGGFGHQILGADEAERECSACHAQNSILITKLYKHQVIKSGESRGFLGRMMGYESYVIGFTRNPLFDWFFGITSILLVIGVAGHGSLRFFARWQRRR